MGYVKKVWRVSRTFGLCLAISSLVTPFASIRDAPSRSRISCRLGDLYSLNGGKQFNSIVEVLPVALFATKENDSDLENLGDDGGSPEKSKAILLGSFLSALTCAVVSAKAGILRGPFDSAANTYGVYTDEMILRDVVGCGLAAALAYVLVKGISLGFEKDGARFFAGSVTLLNGIRLYLAGTGGETSLANAVSRSGDKSEALGGPFIYVCFFQLFILLFWRSSPIGIVAMSTLAAGDGMADIVGRRFGGNNKWWFSESKSIAGSVAFIVFSTLASFGLLNWLSFADCLELSLGPAELLIRVIGISTVCAIVELVDLVDDNYSVPITAAALSALLLQ